MADLTSIADRLNDIEISANAPVTETVNRRVGSNINFLLDFLGIADGETDTTGLISDFITAVSLADSHTMDRVFTLTAAGTFSIGTFTQTKFLNQVFYIYIKNLIDPGGGSTFTWQKDNVMGGTNRFSPTVDIDSAGAKLIGFPLEQKPAPGGTSVVEGDPATDYLGGLLRNTQNFPTSGTPVTGAAREFTKLLNLGEYQAPRQGGAFTNDSLELLLPIIDFDYRDPGTSFEFFLLTNSTNLLSPGADCAIYREYRLNIGSSAF